MALAWRSRGVLPGATRQRRPAGPHSWARPPRLIAALLLLTAHVVQAAKTGDALSVGIEHAPCVRLFHAGGDVGCRTQGREGVAGPLLLVDSEKVLKDLEALVSSTLELEGPEHKAAVVEASSAIEGIGDGFVAVLPESMFSKATLERLSSIGLLSGVLILEGFEGETQDEESVPTRGDFIEAFTTTARESLYSPDVTTPQGDSTPTATFDVDASYPWNPQGDGLLMESLDFPVALVTGRSRAEVRDRAVSNGDLGSSTWRYPLHKAKMVFYFGGSGSDLNSQACLEWTDIEGDRSPQCLPLGGQSSWASIGPAGLGDRETVFAVTGMDSTSAFHDRAPGANSAVSGLVALLAAADSLGEAGRSGVVDFSELPRQVAFAAFQTEAYGFTGSRRFVQDWREGVTCQNKLDPSLSPSGKEACLDPLYPSLELQNLGSPAHVVSIDQVGCLPESTLWVHASPGASVEDRGMLLKASPVSTGGVSLANATRSELPPSPLTAFVKADNAQSGFVISGYDEAFACPNYHSHRDTRASVNASSVTAAAEVLARSTLVLAGGADAKAQALKVNATFVETLLDCLLENWTCDTVREYVVGELANIEHALGFRVSVDAPFPPTLYPGPLTFHYGGGLPTVRHTKDESWRLHPSWSGAFDPDHDKIQLVPNLLEIFCRAFLSEQAASAHAGGYGDAECRSSGDCPSGQCHPDQQRTVSQNGAQASDSGGHAECVRGRCYCPNGFYHIALGVGLEREKTINQYRVIDGALEQGAPLWTEVDWQSIGVEVYLDPGSAVGKLMVWVGTATTAVAGVASLVLFRVLSKEKLL